MELLEELKQLVHILVAVVLGFAIGYERKLRFKEAGIRTHTIVCAGAALMMVVSNTGSAAKRRTPPAWRRRSSRESDFSARG